jgi:hypothetical protein
MTVADLINASLRKIGGLSSGETIEVTRQAEALSALQSMLRSWATKKIMVFCGTDEYFVLTTGKATYTWGTGGDISTPRPSEVYNAFIRDSSGYDYEVRVISEKEYKLIATKTVVDRPQYIYYKPSYPLGILSCYPTPGIAEQLWIGSLKPFTEVSSFATVNDTLAFPSNYEEPLIYNLAVRLAPEYGRSISPEVAAIAKESYNTLVNLNAANQVEPVILRLPAGIFTVYNINTDSVRP